MSGSPKLKRRDHRNQNVQYQRGWPDGCGYDPEQRHHGDVAGRPGVTDAGIKEGDDANRQEKKNEMPGVHHLSCRANIETSLITAQTESKRFLDFARNDKKVMHGISSHYRRGRIAAGEPTG